MRRKEIGSFFCVIWWHEEKVLFIIRYCLWEPLNHGIVRSTHCLCDDLRSSGILNCLILVTNSDLLGAESDLEFRNLRLNIDFGLDPSLWERIVALHRITLPSLMSLTFEERNRHQNWMRWEILLAKIDGNNFFSKFVMICPTKRLFVLLYLMLP